MVMLRSKTLSENWNMIIFEYNFDIIYNLFYPDTIIPDDMIIFVVCYQSSCDMIKLDDDDMWYHEISSAHNQ